MPLAITVPGADFSAVASRFLSAVPSGLTYLNCIASASSDVLARNLASGGARSSVVGAPSWASGWLQVSGGSDYIQTGVPPTLDYTYAVVYRQQADRTAYVFGNFINGSSAHATLATTQGSVGDNLVNVNFQTSMNNGGVLTNDNWATGNVSTPTGPSFIALTYTDATKVKRLWRPATGTDTTRTAANAAYTPVTANCLRIGAGPASSGISEVAAAAAWSRALSTAELQAVYLQMQRYCASQSITI